MPTLPKLTTSRWPYYQQNPAAYKKWMRDYHYFMIEGYPKPFGYMHKSILQGLSLSPNWKVNHEQRLLTMVQASSFQERTQVMRDLLSRAVKEGAPTSPRKFYNEALRVMSPTNELTTTQRNVDFDVRIAVSSSARNDLVGVGGAAMLPASVYGSTKLGTFSSTLGPRSEQNPYSGELAAMERALGSLSALRSSRIELSTRNKAAVLTLRQPRQQSGQQHVCHIYKSITALRKDRNTVTI